ncbi:unnamed protein product [Clonostachys solani]|uniref:Uncharacterized protein n=1 Tax=Clonostachys solani TaxID=160281 RepID=A0A9N9ZF36_9HYPO|nr:unnamed protein product [Clonostachys solani]
MVLRGEEEYLRFTFLSAIQSITGHYTTTPSNLTDLEMGLHDLWYTCIQAAKNITSGEEKQDILLRPLLAAKALGPLRQPGPISDSGDGDGSNVDGVPNSSLESYSIWSGLPLLDSDLIEEFTSRYYQKSYYDEDQRANMAGFLGRLVSVGIYEGSDLCTLSLFRETLEVSRPLVADEDADQVSLEDLTGALEELAQNSIFGLAVLANRHIRDPSSSINPEDYPHLSKIGELATQAGGIPSFGYSIERWDFWIQRLEELSNCGNEKIQSNVEGCLAPMRQAREDTGLL